MKKVTLLCIICLASILAWAHEFWLQPQKFNFTIGEVANIRFRVGEQFEGKNWSGNKEKVQYLRHYTPVGKTIDLASSLSTTIKGDSLQLPLSEEGTHMVVFNSTNSFISLEAEKFNEYLHEDGLETALLYRKAHGEDNTKGTEYYQRSVKTILQAGGNITDACTKPTGLPLDIIPEKNPYSIPESSTSKKKFNPRFQILYKSQPLHNILVKTWYYNNKKQVQMDSTRTNQYGWMTAERHSGPFMVSCVYMERTQSDTTAQWQSYWGSLCFEYSQLNPGKSGTSSQTGATHR